MNSSANSRFGEKHGFLSHDHLQIEAVLKSLANPTIAAHSQRFFKTGPGQYGEGDRFLGIRVPVLRKLARECQDLHLHDAFWLLKSGFHEVRLCALLVLVRQFEHLPNRRQSIYKGYLEHTPYINNWDLVDSSAPPVVGGYLVDRDRHDLHRLAQSDNLWERRIAMLATLAFIRAGDFDDALSIAESLVEDSEELIQKAVGWMLREIGKRDGATQRAFLKRHMGTMPRTMLRYAIEKLPPHERRAYLRGEQVID